MTSWELRNKFLKFFEDKGHKIVPSSSLMPDDPSVLLTTAGMQQFKPYFMGKADPRRDFGTRRVASIQKCFRTSDIDEVGDETHMTFFQMLGHFSFGDYFKNETIEWTYRLLFISGEN
ncbi:MAG: Alanine-tRNA ligase [Parcubacteria group bacterium GW2011_GWA2_44_13]|nr:MAG: Alanine-tRNA ligase [Parcubacteria group bacterium GW2011_GWA2_44_13]